jgi:hypothetical protein
MVGLDFPLYFISIKEEHPDETWWRFLRGELIATAVLGSIVSGYMLPPKETQERLQRAFHDYFEAIHALKGTH